MRSKENLPKENLWLPLPRHQVINAVERRHPSRIPLVRAKWWGEGLHEQYGERLHEFDRYPEDVAMLLIEPLDANALGDCRGRRSRLAERR